ncbi:MAG: iron-sulfur cluster assembly scaffold protein [Paracoccaceae bacterium]|nr:iron-sulfur cluster assembly scaffold protein [Paracoccaceae bacterium]MDE2915227.1 iron-sulfur cluster assembly scaffold protein [Paracoccaceae bacterium]
MTDSNDILKLYSKRILSLAADIPFTTPIANPQGTAKKRSPLCGSTVTVGLSMTNGQISEFGQDVKACALGQASASVLGRHILGRCQTDIERARSQLEAMLKSEGPIPDPPFEGLEVLRPAKDFKNRHASILLAYDATLDAINSLNSD